MKAIDAGLVPGPRMIPSAHALGITGGHCDDTGWAPGILELGRSRASPTGPGAAVRAVRYQIKHGAKVIKTCATAGVLSSRHGRGAAVQLRELQGDGGGGRAARGESRGARARQRGDPGRGQGRGRVHRARLDAHRRSLALMKKRGTYLVPTAYLVGPSLAGCRRRSRQGARVIPLAQESHRQAIERREDRVRHRRRGLSARRERAGVRGLRRVGMTPIEALRSATAPRRICWA